LKESKTFESDAIPLYYQLENILREKISSGEYGPTDAFPTEEQLLNSYKVSRNTVRQALSALEKDGLIVRKRRRGTTVCERKAEVETMKLTGMIEDIIAMGIKTKTRIIDFSFVHAPKKVSKSLHLGESDKVLKIERVRFIKKSPISYSINYLPTDIGEQIGIADINIHPMFNVLEKKCNVKVAWGIMNIEATVADSRTSSLLGVMTGAPLLRIERTVFDTKNRPVDFVVVLYRVDKYHYTVKLVRKKLEYGSHWDYTKP